jgi:radical SAM protein with 4Fe4S-binding SPASM domain
MCNVWKKVSSEKELDINELDRFFKGANKFSWVGITGGEPFLRDDLFCLLDTIVKNSKRLRTIHFNTNGTLTDRVVETIKYLHKKHPYLSPVITVSIDGARSLHDKIRGVEGTWDKAVHTFIRLKQMKSVKTQVGFTLSENNMHAFTETYDALKNVYPNLAFDDINVNVMQKSSFYYSNKGLPDMDRTELLHAIDEIIAADKGRISFNNILRKKYLTLYTRYLETGKSPVRCQSFSATCFLDPYGNLYPCGIYDRKFLNIRNVSQGLNSLWQSTEAKQIGYDCSHNLCPSCWNPCDAHSAMGGSLFSTMLARR